MASLARSILEEHLVRGDLRPGTEIALRVDQTLAQDATGTMALMQFEGFGVERAQVETAVVYVDHNILQIDFKNPDDHRFLQAMAAKVGAWFSRPGNGICHYVHCERFAVPGQTLVGADSHTTQSGSCAMIAIGAGGLDVAVCMAGHPFELPVPQDRRRPAGERAAPAVGAGEGRDPGAPAPPWGARRAAAVCSSSAARAWRRSELHRAGHDRQHDRRARGDRGRLSLRRADSLLARGAGPRRGLRLRSRRAGRRRLRRGGRDRPRGPRAPGCEALEPRQRRPGGRARRHRAARRSASARP